MSAKVFDNEFSPEILKMLKQRDILGQTNWAHYVLLEYNLDTAARAIVQSFDIERRKNPLLETTPPEAWLGAKCAPIVRDIRPNIDVDDAILSKTLQRYFRGASNAVVVNVQPGEQQLCTTLEPYFPLIKKLLNALYERKTSLRAILGIRTDAYTVRAALKTRKPSSPLERTFLQGIKEGWKNHRIARALDEQEVKPRNFESYSQMLHEGVESFYSLKSAIKKKYMATPKSASDKKAQI